MEAAVFGKEIAAAGYLAHRYAEKSLRLCVGIWQAGTVSAGHRAFYDRGCRCVVYPGELTYIKALRITCLRQFNSKFDAIDSDIFFLNAN